jgi:hypothetical protein
MRGPILLSFAVPVCVLFLSLSARPAFRDAPSSSSASVSSQKSPIEEDWKGDINGIRWRDADFAEQRAKVLRYSADPKFASYQAKVFSLLKAADRLRQFARSHCEEAIRKRDSGHILGYVALDGAPGALLEGLAYDMSWPETPETHEILVKDARLAITGANDHAWVSDLLAKYSQDEESIRRFGQDPDELKGILKSAARDLDGARIWLETGDIWAARIMAALGDMEHRYVMARLWDYYEDAYLPHEADQLKK